MKTLQKPIILFLSTLFIISFSGCSKDKDDSSNPKCLVENIITSYTEEYEGEYYSGSGSLDFTYDSQRRLQKFQWSDDEYGIFIYGTNGKIEKVQEYYNGQTYDYLLFTWEGNKVTRQWYWKDGGSYYPSSTKRIIHFNSSNQVTLIEGFYYEENVWIKYWYDNYTWQNGNVVKIEEYYLYDYKKAKSTTSPSQKMRPFASRELRKKIEKDREIAISKNQIAGFYKDYTITFTYDSKKNPFSPHQALFLFEIDWLFLSKNNVVSINEIDHYDGEEWSLGPIIYQYNNEGYPNTFTINESGQWGSRSQTWNFSYNCK